MIDDKNPRRINPKGIGLIYIYIYVHMLYIYVYMYIDMRLAQASNTFLGKFWRSLAEVDSRCGEQP